MTAYRPHILAIGLIALAPACSSSDSRPGAPAGGIGPSGPAAGSEDPPPAGDGVETDDGALPPGGTDEAPDDGIALGEGMDPPADGEGEVVPPVPFTASYHIGADITWIHHDESFGTTYVDSDGETKDILALLKNHGFNSVRLRTFVDPMAADGYDQFDGYGSTERTVEMGRRVKQAGMGLYISPHLSDNWADPGKQCVPVAWQNDTFEELTARVHDYMAGMVGALVEGGARPELVQLGNEVTNGILRHACDAEGLPTGETAVNGGVADWENLGALLRAAAQGVRDVDPTILTVLHLDRGGDLDTTVRFLDNAIAQEVDFDVFANTTYVRWQGEPATWQDSFGTLPDMYPDLKFLIPEYGNETATTPAEPSTMRITNDIVFGIAEGRGVGTWFYEPEHPNQAGIGIGMVELDVQESGEIWDPWPEFRFTEDTTSIYDQLRVDFASRL